MCFFITYLFVWLWVQVWYGVARSPFKNVEFPEETGCGRPPAPSHGSVKLNVSNITITELTATQSCDQGYQMTGGDGNIWCNGSGIWERTITCLKDCGNAPKPEHGTVLLTNTNQTSSGATATQSCNAGYEMATGTGTIECQPDGEWTPSITCRIKDCGSAPRPTHGTVRLTSAGQTVFRSTATQSCNAGNEMVIGTGTIKCQSTGKWSASITCKIKDCGSAPRPTHGTVRLTSAGQTIFRSTATQSCNAGYEMVTGTGTIKCQSTGKWSSSITCKIKDCGIAPKPAYGTARLTIAGQTFYRSTASQSCNAGYKMVTGTGTIICLSTGKWSSSVRCQIKDCGSAPKPEMGTVQLTTARQTFYRSTATQTCNAGYEMVTGTGTITCLSTGKWSSSVTCQIKDCGSAPKPENGTVQLTTAGRTFYRSTATQSCNAGYEMLSGTGTLTCLSTGKWSSSVTCQIKDCGTVSTPANGAVELTKSGQTVYGSTASVLCDAGYEMITGTGTITCLSTGKWSSSIMCQVKDCGSAPKPADGIVQLTKSGQTFYGSTATQSCNAGYEMISGTVTITCLSTGRWSSSIICQIKDCGSAPEPADGTVQPTKSDQTFYGSTASQSCNIGYEMVTGTGTITCLTTGKWSPSIMCQIKDCSSAPKPADGTVQLIKAEQTFYGSTATQSCIVGYEMVTGTGTITCLSTGKWSSSITCQIKDCGSAPKPADGTVQLTIVGQTFYRSTAFQTCNAGYEMVTGTGTIKCLSTGKWSSSIMCQIKDCGTAPKPTNGTIQLTKAGETFYGATASQSCNAGYVMVHGTGIITCEADGSWSSSIKCLIVCGEPTEPKYGNVQLTNTNHTFLGSTARQYCDTGYEMVNDTNTIVCQESGNWSASIVCVLETVSTTVMTKTGTSIKQQVSTVKSLITYLITAKRINNSRNTAKSTTTLTRKTKLTNSNIPTIVQTALYLPAIATMPTPASVQTNYSTDTISTEKTSSELSTGAINKSTTAQAAYILSTNITQPINQSITSGDTLQNSLQCLDSICGEVRFLDNPSFIGGLSSALGAVTLIPLIVYMYKSFCKPSNVIPENSG